MAETEDSQPKDKVPQKTQTTANKELSPVTLCLAHSLLALIFMGSLLYGVLNGIICLHPHEEEVYVQDFPAKFEFLAKYQAPNVFIALMFVFYVISVRVRYPRAANPLSGNEQIVAAAKNILTNTMEQYLIYLVGQVMLITYLDSQSIVKIIPFNCWCFFIGRVTFAIGYPIHRDFGMSCTLLLNTCSVFFCLYKFLNFIDLLDYVDCTSIYSYIQSLYLV